MLQYTSLFQNIPNQGMPRQTEEYRNTLRKSYKGIRKKTQGMLKNISKILWKT